MKDLYNVIESILDDQEDIVDKATDNVIEVQKKIVDQILKHSLQGANLGNTTYDKKNKVIKLYMLMLHLHNNEVCIHLRPLRGKSSAKNIYIPINLATGMGIKFDGSLYISTECINTGFKLSQANIVGSGHKMYIKDLGEINEGKLSSFIDCPVDCFDAVIVTPSRKLVSSPSLGKFPVMKVFITERPSHIDNWAGNSNLEIEYCNSDTLYVTGCQYYIEPSVAVKNKSFFDILKNEKNMEYNGPYTHLCRDLITANPKCKIIVNLSDVDGATLIWMSGNELKFKKTNPAI